MGILVLTRNVNVEEKNGIDSNEERGNIDV
jgi:hypothetical protein